MAARIFCGLLYDRHVAVISRTSLRLGVYMHHAAILQRFFAYGIGHYPYILDPYITIQSSVTSSSMGFALVVAFIGGMCLLVPSLILVFRLFLFDADYVKGKK